MQRHHIYLPYWLLLVLLHICPILNAAPQQHLEVQNKQQLAQVLNSPAFIQWQQQLATELLSGQKGSLSTEEQQKLRLLSGQRLSADIDALATGQPAWSAFAYQVYLAARQHPKEHDHWHNVFKQHVAALSDNEFIHISRLSGYDLDMGLSRLLYLLQNMQTETVSPHSRTARALATELQDFYVYQALLPQAKTWLKDEYKRRFWVQDNLLIDTGDAKVSAILVRSRQWKKAMPTAMQMSIYSDEMANLREAATAVTYGYVGLIVDSRGKGLSPNSIVPYQFDGQDAAAVISWVTRQPWSDQQVGMYGGSYLGFTQWAAAKYMPSGLKTIVPFVPNNPAQGLPYENNVYITANYQWPFYVTNNKRLDNSQYADPGKWRSLMNQWYSSGKAFTELDKLAGQANPWLHKWLAHPGYDEYWQAMQPHGEDFANINIPVLSLNGYYDDGNFSALYYYHEHLKYRPDAEHYWLIGPYDHTFSLSDPLRGYSLDKVAHIDRNKLTFGWFDYVMKAAPRPALLKDKITYQLMGDNSWRYASSLAALHESSTRYYLSNQQTDKGFLLSEQQATQQTLQQQVDLADRTSSNNTDAYPWPIIRDQLDDQTGLLFVSPPFTQDMQIAGSFSGELVVTINKHDVDYGLTFYQQMPDGRLFHLSYSIGRASYAKDRQHRQLLTPGKPAHIPFSQTRMTGRKLAKGSRLLVVLNVNKNASAQVNMGTGQDVSLETAEDGKQPLQLQWHSQSYIDVPLQTLAPAGAP